MAPGSFPEDLSPMHDANTLHLGLPFDYETSPTAALHGYGAPQPTIYLTLRPGHLKLTLDTPVHASPRAEPPTSLAHSISLLALQAFFERSFSISWVPNIWLSGY